MRCPFCGYEETQVKDSRPCEDNMSIRRRRACISCNARFTTFERIQLRELTVIKKSGEKKPFDRGKITRSINMAVRKRDISEEQVQQVVNNIIRKLEGSSDNDIPTEYIGKLVMEALASLDHVAYIRFASVYKDFNDALDFEKFLEKLGKEINERY